MDDYYMEDSVGSSEQVDRLSELPRSLIFHILSFLPMRDVVSTTFLSKRWENLWTTLPCLNFSDILNFDDEPDSNRVRNFVNRALLSWKGTKLSKFTIDIEDYFDKSLGSDMNLWVRLAVRNKVEELSIGLVYSDEMELEWVNVVIGSEKDVYRAPLCLNSCSSLRKLSLAGCNLRIHGCPAWNQLKSLRIDGFCFSECLINQILLGTPQLEVFELRLLESNGNLNIRSTSLKELKIKKYAYFWLEKPSLDTVLRICCPNLEILEISGVFYSECLFANLSSLTDATLDFSDIRCYNASGINLLGKTMGNILSTFQHAERLALSSSSFEVLRASLKKNSFSPLPNVVFLRLEVNLIKPVEMVHLLEIFPNLKMLVIYDCTIQNSPDINAANYLELETNISKSFLPQLKIIQIASFFSNSSIFRCIEILLKHGSMLEKLVVLTEWITPCTDARVLEVAETLLSMPRSSPIAKVIFDNN